MCVHGREQGNGLLATPAAPSMCLTCRVTVGPSTLRLCTRRPSSTYCMMVAPGLTKQYQVEQDTCMSNSQQLTGGCYTTHPATGNSTPQCCWHCGSLHASILTCQPAET